MNPSDYEKLGLFYLGRTYDLESARPGDAPLLYDASDLTTHAVIIGMTGSGKTGLAISLLEEAAIDGIPVVAIDPKGDLPNLMLTFPELRPEDFLPWVDAASAAKRGRTPDEEARALAEGWRAGLSASGQDAARIARFAASAERIVWTPGSRAGRPLALLRTFDAPPAALRLDEEAMRERASGAVSGLLALVEIDADPLRSREHILLTTLLCAAWREGRALELGALIHAIAKPGLERVGVLDLESFFPARERAVLAGALNNLLAAPGFAVWSEGDPLEAPTLLFGEGGRPRLSVVGVAHLSDAERMFVVTLLLQQLIAWMRAQPGSSTLRAILYMDEIFGFFPPTANPPAKQPMLTLLKQARAYGLGVVLATQNPVDLDYKGLSNAGTWFLGRLQTERDQARVLDGLEGASTAAGSAFDRARLEAVLAGLGKRVFLMRDVHEDAPVVFQTRQTLSYLAGPLTREQIRALPGAAQAAATPARVAAAGAPEAAAPRAASASLAPAERPIVPAEVAEGFLAPVRAASYMRWRSALEARLYRSAALELFSCAEPKLVSRPGEGEAEFLARLRAEGRAARDLALAKLRERHAPRVARLRERIAAAEERTEREREQYDEKRLQSAISVGATLVGALFGRKLASATNIGRATTAARGVSRAARERGDVARAEERTEDLRAELAALEAELAKDVAALERGDAATPEVTALRIAPRKSDLEVERVSLVWLPWEVEGGGGTVPLYAALAGR